MRQHCPCTNEQDDLVIAHAKGFAPFAFFFGFCLVRCEELLRLFESMKLEIISHRRRMYLAFPMKVQMIEMRNTHVCPKCGDSRIAGPHRIAGEYTIKVDLPGILTATLDSYTCSKCGYTELYADTIGLENIRKSGRYLQPSSQIQQSRASCPLCGTPVRRGMARCPECGYDLTQ